MQPLWTSSCLLFHSKVFSYGWPDLSVHWSFELDWSLNAKYNWSFTVSITAFSSGSVQLTRKRTGVTRLLAEDYWMALIENWRWHWLTQLFFRPFGANSANFHRTKENYSCSQNLAFRAPTLSASANIFAAQLRIYSKSKTQSADEYPSFMRFWNGYYYHWVPVWTLNTGIHLLYMGFLPLSPSLLCVGTMPHPQRLLTIESLAIE